MKKNVFRPVEFWKSSVMTMPDNSFFELLRSVFGKIKTPFNKQQLINDLEAFLLREDIQKTIAGYIDQNDAKIIAAVALYGEPSPAELTGFFSGELSYAHLQDVIVNLEERFILYRFKEELPKRIRTPHRNPASKEIPTRLALNPVLEQALLPFAADISPLFPAVSGADAAIETSIPAAAILNDRILAGILSFASQGEVFFRTEGVIRKKIIEIGKQIFPGIDLKLILGGLQTLGLFYADGEKLAADEKRFSDFGGLSVRERMEYCAASMMVFGGTTSSVSILPQLFRNRIREIVSFIHCLLDSIKPELLYPEKTLKRLIEILKAELLDPSIINDKLQDVLEKTGLLSTVSPEAKRLGPNIQNRADEKHDGHVITIDSGSSVLVYPEISFTDAISLASVMSIREAGPVVRFAVDRDSAVRAFDKGISADEIVELLKRLSGGRVDDNLIWTFKDWEKRHKEVSLKKGVVLFLSEEKRYLTETRALASLITETLAPGLYLLPEGAMDDAAAALTSAGVDIIARRQAKTQSREFIYNNFTPLSSGSFSGTIQSADMNVVAMQENSIAVQIENFQALLEKMSLGKVEKAELSARINRRLILCEMQLKDAVIRYEKLEAKLLDYMGKQSIARQAIAQPSPVEIVWPGGGKNGEHIFGIPKSLDKDGNDLVLVIVPSDKEEELRIPLGKISLLRRIKKSIFENN
ncbi:MAG: helicase-associated domain-containing protein [Treponema sp.]|jgi:hypothetical protein|nr:helicase-associated domain-containing protein [Treponema sp.]